MFEIQLPAIKKYQQIAGIAAGVGVILGILIPAAAIFSPKWTCPFGDGILHISIFLLFTGLGCGMLLGNLVGVFLIGVAKYRKISKQGIPAPPMSGKGDSDV